MNKVITMKWTLALFCHFLLLTECSGQYHYGILPEYVLKADGGTRVSGIQDHKDKDIILGGLLRVHSHEANSSGGKCGKILLHKSVENMEAMFFAIDLVNNDPQILPNITLGYDIRDTCISENIALDESVDLVLSSGRLELESCLDSDLSSTKLPVVAVIGAIVSYVSIPVASFFRVFNMPQISFLSTSPILSNRDRYTYFYRTIPPDDQQAQGMIDLIIYFGWDHVSTIYSNNLYGRPGIDEFHRLAQSNGLCIDINEGIEDSYSLSNYTALANKLMNSSANVVVLFASINHVKSVLEEVQRLYTSGISKRRFLWIASNAWSEITDFSDITVGKWGIAPYAEKVHSFDD